MPAWDGARRLRVFAGPNGSGKTSLVHELAREYSHDGVFHVHSFVNADEILRDLVGDGVRLEETYGIDVSWDYVRDSIRLGARIAADHAFLSNARVEAGRLVAPAETCTDYVAASVADFVREELLACGASFAFETVMSHESKVEFLARARSEGYRTYLYFVATESPELNVGRVYTRVAMGQHDVPAPKIRERWNRSLGLVRDALAHADRGFLFDNSGERPIWIAEFSESGEHELRIPESRVPRWFRRFVADA